MHCSMIDAPAGMPMAEDSTSFIPGGYVSIASANKKRHIVFLVYDLMASCSQLQDIALSKTVFPDRKLKDVVE